MVLFALQVYSALRALLANLLGGCKANSGQRLSQSGHVTGSGRGAHGSVTETKTAFRRDGPQCHAGPGSRLML